MSVAHDTDTNAEDGLNAIFMSLVVSKSTWVLCVSFSIILRFDDVSKMQTGEVVGIYICKEVVSLEISES